MSQFMERFNALRDQKAYAQIVDELPYIKLMGVELSEDEAGELLFQLPLPSAMSAIPLCRRCMAG